MSVSESQRMADLGALHFSPRPLEPAAFFKCPCCWLVARVGSETQSIEDWLASDRQCTRLQRFVLIRTREVPECR